MIKYECNKGGISLNVNGNITELGADCICLIRQIYEELANTAGVGAAELFRARVAKLLTDADGPFFLPLVSDDSEDAGEAEVREE